jgi:periplasmic protein TonB
MNTHLNALHRTGRWALQGLTAATLGLLSGCDTAPPAANAPAASGLPSTAGVASQTATRPTSQARNDQAYRKDAADHLYGVYAPRIYQGRMPPMLEAVGVLSVDIDSKGAVKTLRWMRAPKHVPHVMAQIERMVKAAAPYPVPRHMRQVTYTDVWLWHESGKFQLDTLTEGQD